jgi:hypothetical protein
MRQLPVLLAACVLSFAAYAADDKPAKPLTAQQAKMAACNKEAGDRKGDERKAFMKECLAAEKETSQDRMKRCNAEAADKKGDERRAFMSECLKAKS